MKPFLPLEIVTEILLRLSIENIAICKCICKAWLNLIESDAFVKSHLSKSAHALAVSIVKCHPNWVNVFKLEDELEPLSNRFDVLAKHRPITKFDFHLWSAVQSSANGLLLLKDVIRIDHLYVCNPITREYVELCGRVIQKGDRFGFGLSKISGQPKVVHHNPESGFHVYTLEAGSGSVWRSVEGAPPFFDYCDYSICGAFFSGNLHWLVKSGTKIPYVCCFDLETERFSKFPAPFMESACTRGVRSFSYVASGGWLYGLVDCLCIHYYDTIDDDVMWFSKEYEQVEKCWTTVQLVMEEKPCYGHNGKVEKHYYGKYAMHAHFFPYVYGESGCQPIKIYRNGGILMLLHDKRFFYYSKEKRNVTEISLFGKMEDDCLEFSSILFTPSFLSLKRNLGMENVKSLLKKFGYKNVISI